MADFCNFLALSVLQSLSLCSLADDPNETGQVSRCVSMSQHSVNGARRFLWADSYDGSQRFLRENCHRDTTIHDARLPATLQGLVAGGPRPRPSLSQGAAKDFNALPKTSVRCEYALVHLSGPSSGPLSIPLYIPPCYPGTPRPQMWRDRLLQLHH